VGVGATGGTTARRRLLRAARAALPVAAGAALVAMATSALAAPTLPKPGTAGQVAALVATSGSIATLPANLLPPLDQVGQDTPGTYYGAAAHPCSGVAACVYGDKYARRLVVLFGDSHAQMWLPAIAPVAKADGLRLALIWMAGCAAATVSVWDAATRSINYACNAWRSRMITKIRAADPTLVLLASRTSDIPGPANRPTTGAAWQAGLERTITELESATTTVAVIGDVTIFSPHPLPNCLAANATDLQACAVQNPNGKTRQHFAAERAAARTEHVDYLNPQPWLCTAPPTTTVRGTCSPVIGNMVAYSDTFHVSATYAEYLSGVWAKALAPLLTRA
jgi:hypothetical protein